MDCYTNITTLAKVWATEIMCRHVKPISVWKPSTISEADQVNDQIFHAYLNITCSLHCTRALCISFGLRAWAWGRQLRANSAAALTMLGSLALDALSANDATSGGVRWPSQHSTKMLRAALPISMACPGSKREKVCSMYWGWKTKI